MRHNQVVLRITGLNAALLILGWLSLNNGPTSWICLIIAYALTGGFLWYLKPKPAN